MKHFEKIQDTLAAIETEIKAKECRKVSKANVNRSDVISSRGRSAALYSNLNARVSYSSDRKKEMDQFKMVMRHPAFKQDPMGAIHQHLVNTSNSGNPSAAK